MEWKLFAYGILRQKYMIPRCEENSKQFEVTQILRDTVTFKYMNLVKIWNIGKPLDFIFCRNVMIYFDKPTRARLVNRFWDFLNPGGILFVGHSESLIGVDHKFNCVVPTIYVRR